MHDDTAPAPLPTGPRQKNGLKRRHRPLNKGGRWLLTLFALPFALTGWGLLLLGVVPTAYDWVRVQSWQPTPATLTAAEFVTNRSTKGRSYRVTATYRYRIDDRDFVGQRVAVSNHADNVGGFQEELGARLTGALAAGTPVTAWVNPSDPQQALLDRSLRPGLLALKLLAGLLFGGFGTVMAVAAWRAGSRAENAAADTAARTAD